MTRDRADVLATALERIFSSSLPKSDRRHHVAELLRDEIEVVRRESIADRRNDDL